MLFNLLLLLDINLDSSFFSFPIFTLWNKIFDMNMFFRLRIVQNYLFLFHAKMQKNLDDLYHGMTEHSLRLYLYK